MKKFFIPVLAGIALISVATMQSCKKDDTTAPVISKQGSSPMTISLNSSFTDPGATASDNEDGTISVTSDYSSTNPNVNLKGTYTIHYTATDKAGNQASDSRTVNVVN